MDIGPHSPQMLAYVVRITQRYSRRPQTHFFNQCEALNILPSPPVLPCMSRIGHLESRQHNMVACIEYQRIGMSLTLMPRQENGP